MTYFNHPLLLPDTMQARDYQINILKTAEQKNTLIVLPTGMGKTPIAIMLAAIRLEKYPDSKILICAPTRPLVEQHEKSFSKFFDLPKNSILTVTGKIPPENRRAYYDAGKIICATPQTIHFDLENRRIDLSKFSLLIIDEAHRNTGEYSYNFVSKKYTEDSSFPRIIGLTASPGSNEEKIKEICANLFADAVEIRTEQDPDVASYVQEVQIETVKVELTDKMKKIQEKLKKEVKNRIEKLKKLDIQVHSKKDLLVAQQKFIKIVQEEKRFTYFQTISQISETIKIWHLQELLETQSIASVKLYFKRLEEKGDKSSKRILEALLPLRMEIDAMTEEHPKMIMIKMLIRKELEKDPFTKIIIFSHYRDNIDQIKKEIESVEGCRPAILIGQAGEKGLKQKEQIEVIKDYESHIYNCLITSPIGEEGLHLSSADLAIFYEPVSSEIRTIQRRGRVGRTKLGRIIYLVTEDTRDEANFYIAKRKEKAMKEILKEMSEGEEPKGETLW